ncbi:MAG: ribonuclease E inhibitor RraB [Pseudomonadota bacterium]
MSTTAIVIACVVAFVGGAVILLRIAGSNAAPDVAVLSLLRQAGSDLNKPHEIEFFLYLPNQAAAERVATKLVHQGFGTSVSAAASGKSGWLLLATRTMVPGVAELVRLRALLSAHASAEQGEYDGWSTPAVK